MLYAAFLSGWFDNLDTWLKDFSDTSWLPLVILALALLDSVVPIVPGETMVIIGGVAAGTGEQNLAVVILAGALGAFIGDNLAYLLGRRASGFLRRTLFRGEKGERRILWAEEQLRGLSPVGAPLSPCHQASRIGHGRGSWGGPRSLLSSGRRMPRSSASSAERPSRTITPRRVSWRSPAQYR